MIFRIICDLVVDSSFIFFRVVSCLPFWVEDVKRFLFVSTCSVGWIFLSATAPCLLVVGIVVQVVLGTEVGKLMSLCEILGWNMDITVSPSTTGGLLSENLLSTLKLRNLQWIVVLGIVGCAWMSRPVTEPYIWRISAVKIQHHLSHLLLSLFYQTRT